MSKLSPSLLFSHSCPPSHLSSGVCSHLWCRQPSGVYSWIHQRSDQEVFLHRKVHTNLFSLIFCTVYHFTGRIICLCAHDRCISFNSFLLVCARCSLSFITHSAESVCMCVCRDSLLASLLDGVRASGNRDVCVKMAPTQRGQRWGLLSMPVDEEVESLHLKFLAAPPSESRPIDLTRYLWCHEDESYWL